MREKALRYGSVDCDVEADKNFEEGYHQDIPFLEGCGSHSLWLDVSTPFRRSIGSAMVGGFTSYSIAGLQRCSILRFGLVFQVHPH
jgi:hypothetical protein